MSGRANVVLPSPPNVVPMREYRAWFDEIGKLCPLQNIQFNGAKFPPNMIMLANKGSILKLSFKSEKIGK
jgi:hypothetical protein